MSLGNPTDLAGGSGGQEADVQQHRTMILPRPFGERPAPCSRDYGRAG